MAHESPIEKEFVSHVVKLMGSFGDVYTKRMFGGYGLFLDGKMFALIAGSVLFLKADKLSSADFKEQGLEMFCYQKKGKECKMSYYQAPEESLEDSDVMHLWVSKAFSAALRAASKKN